VSGPTTLYGVRLSIASVFKPGRVPVIGRFSLDVRQPYETDTPEIRRGLGLQLLTPNGELWRTAMINFPLSQSARRRSFS